MKTVETLNEGLKRGFMLTIPAQDIEARVDGEVKRMAPQVKMPGFRPGKVPANLIRKMHGEALAADALNTAVQAGVQTLLAEKNIRPAMQPEVELDEGYAPGKDAEVRVSLETLPEIPEAKITGIKLERLTAEPDDAALDVQLTQLFSSQKSFVAAPKSHAAAIGDQVVIDYIGTTADGVAFEGGTGEAMALELGSGQLIPGFEDGLVGAKAGDERDVSVTFPKDYPAANLKGKPANFACTVTEVKVQGQGEIDDAFAKNLGLESLDQLKGLLRDQQQQELNGLTRTHMKRKLLDQLASSHDFDVPPSMVDAEYQNIMAQLRHEAEHEDDQAAALAEIESEADDYRNIAVRRVRLGLLLSEIGAKNGVEVSQQEMNRLIGQAAAQYQPKDRERFIQYVQQDPMAAAQLRAPLYEDKVVDYLFEQAEISDRKVARAEIEADLESEEGHVHGPDCGHDHVAPPAKSAKKATKAQPSKAKPVKTVAEPAPAAEAKVAKVAKPKPAKDDAPVAVEAAAKPAKKPAAKKPAAKKA
ncbi:trigger factor [Sphingomonas sp. RB1R13]|uniref:trigger factor n=1 Tax=Sphingomonas sp. RB1R13 TaxID=3096159 RepID=UPI002FCA697E